MAKNAPPLNSHDPVHKQVAERIKDLIARKYKPGDVLPTYREFTSRFNVGLLTVSKAMSQLTDQGIVSPIRRKGTVVTRELRPHELELSRVALIFAGPINQLFSSYYLSNICQAIFERAEALRIDVHLLSLFRGEVGDRPQSIAETGVDGVILLSVTTPEHLAAFAEMDIAAVSADQLATEQGLDSVVCDEAAASIEILQHLARKGHRRVAYVEHHSPRWREGGLQRRQCFHAAAAMEGFEVDSGTYLVEGSAEVNSMVAALAHLLQSEGERPTAIVASSVETAMSLMVQLGQFGIKVPEDVSMASIASSGAISRTHNYVSCCQFDFHEMGQHAMKLLELRRVKPVPPKPSVIEIKPRFLEGSTVVPANGH